MRIETGVEISIGGIFQVVFGLDYLA